MSFGLLLQQARQAAGLSVEQVSEQTRIRPQVIRDLEAGRLESSGGIAYARGHIRSISKVIGADPEVLVAQFNSQIEEANSPMIDLLAENSATPLTGQKPKLSYKKLSAIAVGIILVIVIASAISTQMHSKTPSAVATFTPLPKSSATPTTTRTTTPSPTASPTASTTSTTPPITASTVSFKAVGANSWFSVTDKSGTVLWHGTLYKGATESFTLSGLINVTIGNAGAVDVTINGKDAGFPGALGQVVNIQYGPGASS